MEQLPVPRYHRTYQSMSALRQPLVLTTIVERREIYLKSDFLPTFVQDDFSARTCSLACQVRNLENQFAFFAEDWQRMRQQWSFSVCFAINIQCRVVQRCVASVCCPASVWNEWRQSNL